MENKLYLDDQVLQLSQPVTCCVCEQATQAACTCADCGKAACLQCQHYHARVTSTHRLQSLALSDAPTPTEGLDLATGYEESAGRQVRILDAALSLMDEERRMLQQQRQRAADTISNRADTVRALVSQAEERSQRALAEVVDREENWLLQEMSQARVRREKLVQITSRAGANQNDPQTELVSDETLLYYQQRISKGRQATFLIHRMSDFVIDPKLLEEYLGVVQGTPRAAGQRPGDGHSLRDDGDRSLTVDVLVSSTSPTSHDMTSDGQGPANNLNTLQSEDKSLQRIIDAIRRDANKVRRKATKIQDDVNSLHTALAMLEGVESKTQTDLSPCQDAGTLPDDHTDPDFLKEVAGTESLPEQQDKEMDNVLREGLEKGNKQPRTGGLQRRNASIPTEIGALSQMFTSLKSKARPLVAFHVRLNPNTRLGENFLVKHDVRCNIGRAYDPQTGVFITPVTGVYLFLATELKLAGAGSAGVRISVDGTGIEWAKSRHSSLGSGVSCTSHVAVRLASGQRVSVSAGNVSAVSTWLLLFSGMLMQS